MTHLGDLERAERARAAGVDDPLLGFRPVERHLLLEQEGVALDRQAADVERVDRVGQDLAKVGRKDRGIVLGRGLLDEAGDAGRRLSRTVVQAGCER
jgi:hypothetical protein